VSQRVFRHLAAWFAGNGVRVVTIDYRGVGASKLDRSALRTANLTTWATRDAVGALRFVEQSSKAPVVLLGHSFGGQALGFSDEFRRLHGAIMVGSQFGLARHWDGLARVNAPDCAVQSNSKDPAGLSAKKLSLLTSSYTCSSGGYDGDLSLYMPAPDTDCPTVDDPLELRQPPSVGGCDFDGVTIDISQTIAPGHYCGGLSIRNGAEVTAEPGIYIISGGPLEVKNSASLKGDGVGFYFDDDAATFDFKNHSVVELSGPTAGPLAGLLFFENPSAKEGRDFKISSDEVRKLIGTIYLPRGTFEANAQLDETVKSLLDPLRTIGDASTYTIIVANKIELDGVNLVINADYAASDVPVPSGLGPKSNKVRLVK